MADFRILSLDGGGAWAIIQVKTLIDLYSKKGDGTDVSGHDVLRKFDLAISNSGGSITLGGLIKDLTLAHILELFRDQSKRESIFVKIGMLEDPGAHIGHLVGIGPKYSAKAKLSGLRAILGQTGDMLVSNLPAFVGTVYSGRTFQVVICGFDYDQNRETFFRSDSGSLAASRGSHPEISLAQAIHASSNAPVNYFDAPALGPNMKRYWDGAIGGYNNPALAGVIEALTNCGPYNTDRQSIRVLSLGTANVALPVSSGAVGQEPDLVVHPKGATLVRDLKKLATAIVDDPPDAATFHAHVMLGCPMPGPADSLPGSSQIVRMNPMIQPIAETGGLWRLPNGLSMGEFVRLRDLDMDAVAQQDVDLIERFCELWLAGEIPNQAIRASTTSLTPEIGHGRYQFAEAEAHRCFP